jgi:hypothetical protein
MRPLPVRPPPVPNEPIMDYLERLANSNGYNLREFQAWFASGQGICTKTLTESLGGLQLPAFSGPANPRVKVSVNSFGLQAADFTRMRRRWCPTCIAREAWVRPFWRLKTAIACSVHRVRLLQSCPRCHSYPDLQSILNGMCVCGVNFVEVLSQATRAEIQISKVLNKSLFQTATFDLRESEIELDTPQIVRLICYTGQFSKGPLLHRPGKIRDLESIDVATDLVAGAATLLADWPSAFWHCLELFVKAAPDDASVRRVFGPLYHVLYQDLRDPAFHFLRSSFELFLLEHWRGELCGRHRLFSEETINKHRHQGLARVARSAGLGSKRLRRMVHQDRFPANTFNPNSTKHLITVDKEVLARLLPNPNDYLDLRATARLLGFKRTRLRQLVAHGVLLADAKPDFRISNRWNFRRSEVLDLLDTIRQGSGEIPETIPTITLNHALRYWRVSATELGELIHAVKQREILYALTENGVLGGLVLGEHDLRAWFSRTRRADTSWVSVSKAADLLGLKEQVVYELVSKNLIMADVIATSGHAVRRLKLTSVEHFKMTFVSGAELAKQQDISPRNLLKTIGALPTTGPSVDGGRQYFFRRADLGICTEPVSGEI